MRIRRRTVVALAAVLLLGGSAAMAAAPAYSTGRLLVAGAPIPPTQILDARALPDTEGRPSLMVTLSPAGAAAVTGAAKGAADLAVTLDGRPLGTSPAATFADGHALLLSGDYGDYAAAAALARRISGRDPLPESEGDE